MLDSLPVIKVREYAHWLAMTVKETGRFLILFYVIPRPLKVVNHLRTTGRLVKMNQIYSFEPIRDIVSWLCNS